MEKNKCPICKSEEIELLKENNTTKIYLCKKCGCNWKMIK